MDAFATVGVERVFEQSVSRVKLFHQGKECGEAGGPKKEGYHHIEKKKWIPKRKHAYGMAARC